VSIPTTQYPAPDVTRATRGRFLRRHGARVIEQDDLLIVEFVGQEPWYTTAVREGERERALQKASMPRLFAFALLMFTVSASALYGAARWLRWI